jgi:hypothetical protein
VETVWQHPFSAVEFFGVGRSVLVSFQREKPQRTVGDALKERWERGLASAGIVTAANSR